MPRVRWLTFALLLPLLAGCSFLAGTPDATPEEATPTPMPALTRAATPPRATPTVAATRPPASTRGATAPTAVPANPPADPPASSGGDGKTLMVAHTDGEGVYIRAEPVSGERLRAYAEGTELTVIGAAQAGDGRQWLPVRGPDGVEGWVPEEYTAEPGSVPIVVATPLPVETVAEATIEEFPTAEEVVEPDPTVAIQPTPRPPASPTVATQPTSPPPTATEEEEEEPREQTDESTPCLEGQVKANNDEGVYYRPGQDGYEDLQAQVTCFDDEDDAREAGYVRAR